MNALFEAAYEIHQFLTSHKIPYAIIGGLAVQYWGEARFTQDVDVTILIPFGKEDAIVSEVLKAFPARIENAADFARKNRVILIKGSGGGELDVSLGIPGYEEEVAVRAIDFDLGDSRTVKLCSAEDLIIHKAVAGRGRDCSDIEGIIVRQGKRLNIGYIKRWLEEFARALENDEILSRFTDPWKKLAK